MKKTTFLLLFFPFLCLETLMAQTTVNIAPDASLLSASFTASWNSLIAINNRTTGYGLVGGGTPSLGNSETWASWSSSRPSSQWLGYEWAKDFVIGKSTVYFWADNAATTAGSGVAVPASWKIQYWNKTTQVWTDVTLLSGQTYPKSINASNTVLFENVTTNKLRLTMNASSDGTTFAALGVTEWEVYSTLTEPTLLVNANRLILSDFRGKNTVQINVRGVNLPADGIQLSLSEGMQGVQLSRISLTQAEAQSVSGCDVRLTFLPEQGKTATGNLIIRAGSVNYPVTLMTSKDNDCFTENSCNLTYDPRFLTMDRLTTWSTPPTIVTLADGEDVKCGATCLKFLGTSGIEMKSTLYLGPGRYKTSGWIKTNGTFETGIYGNGAGFSSSDPSVVEQTANYIYFTLPDTKGVWQYYERAFNVQTAVLGGAWVNNAHNETATTVFLDNWQIYDVKSSESSQTIDTLSKKDYPIQPVSFVDVKFNDIFWAPRIQRNQDVTIPIALNQCYITGRVDNFKKAGGLMPGYFSTEYTFDDTDIYKILEGMSYSVQSFPNPALEAQMDTLIGYIGKAQESDGYLYTARTAGKPGSLHAWVGPNRWEWDPNLSHELYNCGHLYEAAVAHFKATGKRSLLDIAIKNADLLVKDFLQGGLTYEPGHQIVEMGLVKMYRVTGKKDYLDLAKYFLDLRGTKGVARSEYSQSNLPVTRQTTAVGHAVRAVYMYSGMADVAALTNDKTYLNAIDTIWQNAIFKKYYITGGIGAKKDGEAFDNNYVLPNENSYCETCAAIGHVYWNHRLFLLHGDSKYYDIIERNLYNGVISGISLSGDHFFYPNPLQSQGQYTRSPWFGCACCPSNLCRFTASVPGYMYAQKNDSLYVNLYVQGNASVKLGADSIHLLQTTNYPWDGHVNLQIQDAKSTSFTLVLRIPGWARNKPVPGDLYTYLNPSAAKTEILLNGNKLEYVVDDKGYVAIKRTWQTGDRIVLNFPMDVHRVIANSNVVEDRGKVSLERGPIVYALEWPDNNGHVLNSVVADNDSIAAVYQADKLTGIVGLRIAGKVANTDIASKTVVLEDKMLNAIPYYAWDNRGAGEMSVWLARTAAYAKATPKTDTLTYRVVVKPDFGTSNTNYPFTILSVDKQAVYKSLGLQQADLQSKFGTTVIYAALNSTGSLNTTSTAGAPGHWFDRMGGVTQWNTNSVVFSEMDLANLAFKIGLFPGLSKEGDSYCIQQVLTYTVDNMATRIVFKFDVSVSNQTDVIKVGEPKYPVQYEVMEGQLTIRNIPIGEWVKVFDMSGRIQYQSKPTSTTLSTILPSGVYLVAVGASRQKVVVS